MLLSLSFFTINAIDLPPLTFSLDQSNGNSFYIPLEALLLPPSAFDEEEGAPFVNIKGDIMRLCVIKNGDINDATSIIALGTLALHSLYFAADYTNNRVGLASKLSGGYTDELSLRSTTGAICSARIICKGLFKYSRSYFDVMNVSFTGDETYEPSTNSCQPPLCNRYYFSHLDVSTSTCSYNSTAYGFGVAFVLAVTIMEVLAFFSMQHSAVETIRYDIWHEILHALDGIVCTLVRFMA